MKTSKAEYKNESIKCIIVDDEPLSQEVVERYVNDFPRLELFATCSNAIEAIEVIQNQSIDLIFLDINMPKLSGINFLKSLNNPPLVIFTTAYPEYAVQGFDLDVVDYLLKPFSFDRFLKAVNKAIIKLNILNEGKKTNAGNSNEQNYLLIKADKKIYKTDYDDILYFQSCGDYVKIIAKEKTLISHKTLKDIYSELPEHLFVRIHKSYIIPLKRISFIEGNRIYIGKESLPIGLSFKENLLAKLNKEGK
jgi:DNA-binding LytR/AlgR family response regulator